MAYYNTCLLVLPLLILLQSVRTRSSALVLVLLLSSLLLLLLLLLVVVVVVIVVVRYTVAYYNIVTVSSNTRSCRTDWSCLRGAVNSSPDLAGSPFEDRAPLCRVDDGPDSKPPLPAEPFRHGFCDS